METSEAWPAWGRLIDDARERLDLSQNEAAKRAEMSGTRWRQIVSGTAGPMASERGVKTVVRMARIAGLTHKAFEGVRDDVMHALLDIEVAERMSRSDEVNADSEEIIRRIQRRLSGADRRQLEALEQWVETFFPDVDPEMDDRDNPDGGAGEDSAIA